MNEYEGQDYTEGYRASMEELRNSPGYIEVDSLCWHVFSTPDGEALLKLFKEKFIYQGTPTQISESYPISCVYMEGYRAAFRYLIEMVSSYQSKKDHEAKELQQPQG